MNISSIGKRIGNMDVVNDVTHTSMQCYDIAIDAIYINAMCLQGQVSIMSLLSGLDESSKSQYGAFIFDCSCSCTVSQETKDVLTAVAIILLVVKPRVNLKKRLTVNSRYLEVGWTL